VRSEYKSRSLVAGVVGLETGRGGRLWALSSALIFSLLPRSDVESVPLALD
jgi:hypothetical protein